MGERDLGERPEAVPRSGMRSTLYGTDGPCGCPRPAGTTARRRWSASRMAMIVDATALITNATAAMVIPATIGRWRRANCSRIHRRM